MREETLRAAYYGQFDFTPHISEKSRKIGRPTGLHELCYNERGRLQRMHIEDAIEGEFNA